MEMPFEIQRGNIPAQSSHQAINKSTICGQKLKVKNAIHHEWKPLLKFTMSFMFKQRVHLCRFSSHDTVDNRSDSWVKREKLDATCFIITLFSAQHVSDVNTSILRSLRLIRWVTSWVVAGSMCVGVTLQCGYGGVVSVCRLQPAYGYHTTIAPLQRNTNTHRTRYNPWSNSTN